jgi:CDP-4-dehydro-6-deoxyglucose reductase
LTGPLIAAHVTSITHHDSGGLIPLSIASTPERLPELELHYRPTPGVVQADLMNDLLARSNALTEWHVDGPYGNVTVEESPTDALWLIAGGTGITQCCAIVDRLNRVTLTTPVSLLWSVTDRALLYCDSELRAFAHWLSYRPLVDAPGFPNAAADWLRQTDETVHGRVILSGSPGFVYAVEDVLRNIAATGTSIESDVFSYAPRP